MVQLAAFLLLMGSAVESRRIPTSDLPCDRISGVARQGNSWLVGGIRGLFLGEPGSDWKELSDQSVRQMVTGKNGTWVLYGNGSIDKVDIRANRIYNDVLRGVAKRPWAASLWLERDTLVIGGHGGWIERTGDKIVEHYPPEMSGQPVTALSGGMFGTQNGLFTRSSRSDEIVRLGFASGLQDIWITALIPSSSGAVAGLSSGGLAIIRHNSTLPLDSPSRRVRHLFRWNKCLVMGALDGAWLRVGTDWEKLVDEEATFFETLDGELIVGTPSGIRCYKWMGSSPSTNS